MLAAVIAGHHSGLSNPDLLDDRLSRRPIESYARWRQFTGELPAAETLDGTRLVRRDCDKGFERAFLVRMLFSCLVDADYLETERAVAEAGDGTVERGLHAGLDILASRLRAHMTAMRARPAMPMNDLRNTVLDHVLSGASLAPGLFTLSVPTGGGKTLASLSFALEHALLKGMRRVVYVIPFTSIIEQTAAVFREALGTEADVLEHHTNFDWDRAPEALRDDGEGPDGLAKLRRAAENWDVPVVVTTAVQFFESLFAARPSRCRKLHNLAGAVIVLDEAQTLPIHLLRPCMAALDELARNYGASVVLCTATQPALLEKDGFLHGFTGVRELAPDPARLHAALHRVNVRRVPAQVSDAEIAARFAAVEAGQMLCIVNTRGHARALFEAIREQDGAMHLTTLMCPRHRRQKLAEVRRRLHAKLPVRLVATSLIEAGVDVSFPEVWRAAAGLDAIAQAAGRCNREGGPVPGRVVVFDPAEAKPLPALKQNWQAAQRFLREGVDPLAPDAIREYFSELYWHKGEEAMDAAVLGKDPWPIMKAIAERARECNFPFASIAEAFRMIDDVMQPVIVPWSDGPDDTSAKELLDRLGATARPLASDLRRVQQYVVGIPRKAHSDWLAAGVLRCVRADMGERLLRFEGMSHYSSATGVNLLRPEYRNSEENIP